MNTNINTVLLLVICSLTSLNSAIIRHTSISGVRKQNENQTRNTNERHYFGNAYNDTHRNHKNTTIKYVPKIHKENNGPGSARIKRLLAKPTPQILSRISQTPLHVWNENIVFQYDQNVPNPKSHIANGKVNVPTLEPIQSVSQPASQSQHQKWNGPNTSIRTLFWPSKPKQTNGKHLVVETFPDTEVQEMKLALKRPKKAKYLLAQPYKSLFTQSNPIVSKSQFRKYPKTEDKSNVNFLLSVVPKLTFQSSNYNDSAPPMLFHNKFDPKSRIRNDKLKNILGKPFPNMITKSSYDNYGNFLRNVPNYDTDTLNQTDNFYNDNSKGNNKPNRYFLTRSDMDFKTDILILPELKSKYYYQITTPADDDTDTIKKIKYLMAQPHGAMITKYGFLFVTKYYKENIVTTYNYGSNEIQKVRYLMAQPHANAVTKKKVTSSETLKDYSIVTKSFLNLYYKDKRREDRLVSDAFFVLLLYPIMIKGAANLNLTKIITTSTSHPRNKSQLMDFNAACPLGQPCATNGHGKSLFRKAIEKFNKYYNQDPESTVLPTTSHSDNTPEPDFSSVTVMPTVPTTLPATSETSRVSEKTTSITREHIRKPTFTSSTTTAPTDEDEEQAVPTPELFVSNEDIFNFFSGANYKLDTDHLFDSGLHSEKNNFLHKYLNFLSNVAPVLELYPTAMGFFSTSIQPDLQLAAESTTMPAASSENEPSIAAHDSYRQTENLAAFYLPKEFSGFYMTVLNQFHKKLDTTDVLSTKPTDLGRKMYEKKYLNLLGRVSPVLELYPEMNQKSNHLSSTKLHFDSKLLPVFPELPYLEAAERPLTELPNENNSKLKQYTSTTDEPTQQFNYDKRKLYNFSPKQFNDPIANYVSPKQYRNSKYSSDFSSKMLPTLDYYVPIINKSPDYKKHKLNSYPELLPHNFDHFSNKQSANMDNPHPARPNNRKNPIHSPEYEDNNLDSHKIVYPEEFTSLRNDDNLKLDYQIEPESKIKQELDSNPLNVDYSKLDDIMRIKLKNGSNIKVQLEAAPRKLDSMNPFLTSFIEGNPQLQSSIFDKNDPNEMATDAGFRYYVTPLPEQDYYLNEKNFPEPEYKILHHFNASNGNPGPYRNIDPVQLETLETYFPKEFINFLKEDPSILEHYPDIMDKVYAETTHFPDYDFITSQAILPPKQYLNLLNEEAAVLELYPQIQEQPERKRVSKVDSSYQNIPPDVYINRLIENAPVLELYPEALNKNNLEPVSIPKQTPDLFYSLDNLFSQAGFHDDYPSLEVYNIFEPPKEANRSQKVNSVEQLFPQEYLNFLNSGFLTAKKDSDGIASWLKNDENQQFSGIPPSNEKLSQEQNFLKNLSPERYSDNAPRSNSRRDQHSNYKPEPVVLKENSFSKYLEEVARQKSPAPAFQTSFTQGAVNNYMRTPTFEFDLEGTTVNPLLNMYFNYNPAVQNLNLNVSPNNYNRQTHAATPANRGYASKQPHLDKLTANKKKPWLSYVSQKEPKFSKYPVLTKSTFSRLFDAEKSATGPYPALTSRISMRINLYDANYIKPPVTKSYDIPGFSTDLLPYYIVGRNGVLRRNPYRKKSKMKNHNIEDVTKYEPFYFTKMMQNGNIKSSRLRTDEDEGASYPKEEIDWLPILFPKVTANFAKFNDETRVPVTRYLLNSYMYPESVNAKATKGFQDFYPSGKIWIRNP